MFDDTLYSKELEMELLGGLINNPEAFPEIDSFITVDDFYSKENYYIYFGLTQIISDYVASSTKVNATLLHDKVFPVFKDRRGLDLLEYIRDLSFYTASFDDTIKSAKSLSRVTYKRLMDKKLEEARKLVREEGSIDKINADIYESITSVEKLYTSSSDPINITACSVGVIEDRVNNPKPLGIPWPDQYSQVNKIMGDLVIGQVSIIGARAKQGKTTMLADIAESVAARGTKVLFIDTEMDTRWILDRRAAAMSGISFYEIATGYWKPESVQKWNAAKPEFDKRKPFFHIHQPLADANQLCSIIRRFKHSHCKKDENFLVIYDYMHLTGEATSNHHQGYQILTDKTTKLKAVCHEMGAACLAAVQLNRGGENKNRKSNQVTRDLSVIAGSDGIAQKGDKIFWWGKKSEDEMHEDNIQGQGDYGTHMLLPLAARIQGEYAMGFDDSRRRIMDDGSERSVPFYFNFEIKNFKVTEMGSLDDIIARSRNRRRQNDSSDQHNQERDGAVELE